MKAVFLVPNSNASPHACHRAWAKTFCHKEIRTPMRKGIGMIVEIFKEVEIPADTKILFCESSYCLPFAKRFKDSHEGVKIILLVADTTYLKESHTIPKYFYVWHYTKYVDYFIAVSEMIKEQIKIFSDKPVEVVRPYMVMGKENENKFREISMREKGVEKTGYEIA